MTHQNSIPFFANKILPKKQMLQRCLQRYFKSPFSSISHKKASILARVDIEPVFLVLRVWLLLKFYDCLVFSQIINSYPLVAVFEFLVRGTQVGGLDYLVRCLPSRPNHLRNIQYCKWQFCNACMVILVVPTFQGGGIGTINIDNQILGGVGSGW